MQMTQADFDRIVATLPDSAFTADGRPDVRAFNGSSQLEGFDPISAQERNNFAAAPPEPEPELEDAPAGTATVTITEAMTNPVVIYVNAIGLCRVRVGEPTVVPVAALDALNDVDGLTYSKE